MKIHEKSAMTTTCFEANRKTCMRRSEIRVTNDFGVCVEKKSHVIFENHLCEI